MTQQQLDTLTCLCVRSTMDLKEGQMLSSIFLMAMFKSEGRNQMPMAIQQALAQAAFHTRPCAQYLLPDAKLSGAILVALPCFQAMGLVRIMSRTKIFTQAVVQ